MTTRIQYRRDTAANWTAVNPVLAAGEPGYETETDKYKIGDGVSAWSALVYHSDDAANNSTYALITSVAPVTLDGGNATFVYTGTFNFDGGSAI